MEMQSCWPYLMDQIKLIRPSVMVALGGTAVRGLLGRKTVGITRLRGQFQDFRGIPVMPTYHPAYVLRNPSKNIKRQVWEDMLQVMEHLKMPISAKQRQFFTK
jgi:DNA polymerase